MDYGTTVRAGYNQAAEAYLRARPKDSPDIRALEQLLERLRPGSLILDAGCGAGEPVARLLNVSHQVIGIDFSTSQLALAHRSLPEVGFACQDLTRLGLASLSFDAICSYYAIIHIPREQHESILTDFYRLLRPGGLAFLCLGAADLDDDFDDDYYGVRMYWSHYDATTNLALLTRARFEILWWEIISDSLGDEEATGGHLFVLAQKPLLEADEPVEGGEL